MSWSVFFASTAGFLAGVDICLIAVLVLDLKVRGHLRPGSEERNSA